jgi:hypothetical protein
MNAMKKIFLLSLLSVLLLPAFSQISGGTEILEKINIYKSIDPSEFDGNEPQFGFWLFFYKQVISEPRPGGGMKVYCSGCGWKMCIPKLRMSIEGVDNEFITNTCEDITKESEERIFKGELGGSISSKIAFSDPLNNGKISYLLFQITWKHDPNHPYNGQAEIIISKTTNFGLQ